MNSPLRKRILGYSAVLATAVGAVIPSGGASAHEFGHFERAEEWCFNVVIHGPEGPVVHEACGWQCPDYRLPVTDVVLIDGDRYCYYAFVVTPPLRPIDHGDIIG